MTPAGLYALTTVLDQLAPGKAAPRAPASPSTPGAAGAADGAKSASTTATARAATAATVGNAAALPLPATELPSTLPMLSGLAQLVTRISAGDDGAAALAPVALPTPAADTAELPAAIREAVQQSGLFYESHLEDWVAGRRSLEDVLNEPQARFTQRHLGELPSHEALPLPKSPDAATLSGTDARASDAASSSFSNAGNTDATSNAKAPDAWQPPRALEPIVREQLAVLAQGAASVPLVPWPGQGATLEIRDEARAPGAPEDAAPAFRVSLKMTLPELGRVEFVLSAQGDAIRVAAAADEASSRDALASRSRELRDALAARALSLDAMEIGIHAD